MAIRRPVDGTRGVVGCGWVIGSLNLDDHGLEVSLSPSEISHPKLCLGAEQLESLGRVLVAATIGVGR